jgi:hypothetical protein
MKSSVLSGFIAGLASGLLTFIMAAIAHGYKIYPFIIELTHEFPLELEPPILSLAISDITLGIIWGIVFGIIYSKVYKSIPGVDMEKSINFILIVWLIAWFPASLFWLGYGFDIPETYASALLRFIQLLLYGIFLGTLYQK